MISVGYPTQLRMFWGHPWRDALDYIRRFYPLADIHFEANGRIWFSTGLLIGSEPIMIKTDLFAAESIGELIGDTPKEVRERGQR